MLPARVFDIAAEIAGPPTGSPPYEAMRARRVASEQAPWARLPATSRGWLWPGLAWFGFGFCWLLVWISVGFRLDFDLI